MVRVICQNDPLGCQCSDVPEVPANLCDVVVAPSVLEVVTDFAGMDTPMFALLNRPLPFQVKLLA